VLYKVEGEEMKQHVTVGSLLAIAGMAVSTFVSAGCPAPITLPAPGDPSTSVQFGDAVVYALPLLEDAGVISSGVQSSPGQINDCIVVASGAGGQVLTNSPPATPITADDAYSNVQGDQNPYFRTGDTTLPNNTDPVNGPVPGDTDHTWDITIGAVNDTLAGGTLVFMFNHNQTGSTENSHGGTGAPTEDLFIWAQIAVRNVDPLSPDFGTVVYFYATAVDNTTGLTNFGQPGGDPTTYLGPQTDATSLYPSAAAGAGTFPTGGECSGNGGADGLPLCSSGTGADYFIRARGRVCLTATDIPVPCDIPDGSGGTMPNPAVDHFINDNLGANQVANAVVFPELNAILANPGAFGFTSNSVIQIDLRMGCNAVANGGTCPAGSVLNNGYEQIFIIGGPEIPTVPEPATVGLCGIALLGLFAVSRKRRRR